MVNITLSMEPYHGRWSMLGEDAEAAKKQGSAAVAATFGDSVAEKPPSGVSETMRVESNRRGANSSAPPRLLVKRIVSGVSIVDRACR